MKISFSLKSTRSKRRKDTAYYIHDIEHNEQGVVYYAHSDELIEQKCVHYARDIEHTEHKTLDTIFLYLYNSDRSLK